jgi:hypothetical protein
MGSNFSFGVVETRFIASCITGVPRFSIKIGIQFKQDAINRVSTTTFFQISTNTNFKQKNQKKIRSYPPDPLNPFSHRIALSKTEIANNIISLKAPKNSKFF